MSTKIKVLNLGYGLGGYGGTERTLFVYAKYLNKDRFDVRVHCIGASAGTNTGIYAEHALPYSEGDNLTEVLRSFQPDIVHIHRGGWESPEHIEAIKAAGVPTLIETNVFGRPNPHPSTKLIDCHIFVSYFCLRRYHEWVGHPLVSDRYVTLYNPLDPVDFKDFSSARDVSFCVGRHSRDDDKKWHSWCYEMFPALRATLPQVRYRIAGATPTVKSFFREHQLEENVDYLPLTHDRSTLMHYLENINVFAHGSAIGESFGIVIAEAMAAGLPVVTHPSRGSQDNAQTELVEHGVTGFVVNSAQEYAQAIAFLLSNPEEAQKLGDAAQKKAMNCYSASRLTPGLEELYEHFYRKGSAARAR